MTAILTSLGLLVIGAAASALLNAKPRAALLVALVSTGSAALFVLVAVLPILFHPQLTEPLTFAWRLPLGAARLAIDGLSAWFLSGIAVLSVAASVYSWPYMRAEAQHGSIPAFGAFLCLLVASLILLVTAADVVLFLAAWESMTLSAFFLVAFRHRQTEVRRGAWMYLIATHLGTALCVFPMFAIVVARAHSTDFSALRAGLENCGPRTGTLLFLLGLIGFGTKAGFMPMHVWLPVAHPAAPTPVSALLSGVVIKIGIYGLLRLLSWLPPLPTSCGVTMLVFGIASGVLGVLYALAQHDLKRLLAYHSVENIGIIGLGIGMGMLGQSLGHAALVVLGYSGALLHVLNHALFKGLLFLSAGAVIQSTGTGEIDRLGGLARKTPVNAALFLIAAVSICGLPPFNGFVSEWLVYGALFGGAFGTAPGAAGPAALGAVSLALMGGLALACFAKVFGAVFLGQSRCALRNDLLHPLPTAGLSTTGMSMLAAMCIVIGLLPSVFVPLTTGGVAVVAHLPPTASFSALQNVLAPLAHLSGLIAVLLTLTAGLAWARTAALRRNRARPEESVATWSCGYALPTPRMQYTASSFAWSLIRSFHQLLWPSRHATRPIGCFPGSAHLESHTPDMAEHDVFAPIFRGLGAAFQSIRTVSWPGQIKTARGKEAQRGMMERHVAGFPGLQASASPPLHHERPARMMMSRAVHALRRGSIHMYLAFMVLTLLAVFCFSSLRPPAPSSTSRPAMTNPDRRSEVSK